MFLKTPRITSPSAGSAIKAATLVALATIALSAVSAGAQGSSDPSFDRPLFSDNLFGNDDMGSSLDRDVAGPKKTASVPRGPSVAQQITNSQVDSQFMTQLARVAHYLQLYGVRNGSRFPGLANDEGYAAQVQLNELVPNNPYNPGYTQNSYNGMPAWNNPNGSPATGSPVWGDQVTEWSQTTNGSRVLLSMDYGITKDVINMYAQNPPSEWSGEAPGTINCIGNGQGLFIVWGAGRDGRPIKNPMNGLTYIQSGSTSGTVNDQAAPNEGGIP